jgi:hypothetical protein
MWQIRYVEKSICPAKNNTRFVAFKVCAIFKAGFMSSFCNSLVIFIDICYFSHLQMIQLLGVPALGQYDTINLIYTLIFFSVATIKCEVPYNSLITLYNESV